MRNTVLLDGNIYDQLSRDIKTRTVLVNKISAGLIRVVAIPTLEGELSRSPFGGLPDWFPIEIETDSVCVVGHSPIGTARPGSGDVYNAHRGGSRHVKDAIIADAADDLAHVLVTDDRRFRVRLSQIRTKCQVMDYEQFRNWLFAL